MSRITFQEKDRARKLKALGNAIVPQVAFVILSALKDADESHD